MSIRTTAAVIESAGTNFTLAQVELSDLRPDEVLVRIVAVGLCHSDLTVAKGFTGFAFPGILGHEGAGVVEAVGSAVTRAAIGDHVSLSFTSCGVCARCATGHPAYCDTWVPRNLFNNGLREDGSSTAMRDGSAITARFFGQSSFAAHAVVDERCVVVIDREVPFEIAAPLGCGVQTGAGAVLNVLKPDPGATLAVFGTGAVGLSALMAARSTAASTIIAVDVVASRLEVAESLGATHLIDASTEDVTARIGQITGGAGLDDVVDTTASPAVFRTITDNLAAFGTLAVVGAAPLGTEGALDIGALLTGRTIVGVTEGDSDPQRFIPTLIDLYRAGRLPLDRIVTTYPFADIDRAAADAESGRVIKPVLVFG